jgi:hypothetical protein
MKRLVILFALVACGGDDPRLAPDAPIQPMPDAPIAETTLTTYVIDLVKNQTASNTQAKAYSEFSGLPDPDSNNAAAYTSLFP